MKVRHPVFPDVVIDVGELDRWVAAGWVPVEPAPEPEPEPKPRPKPRPRRRR